MEQSALLVLEDGTDFQGLSMGVNGRAVGEVVFNTAMSGYQEILTDPSYAKQIITFTYPHIGNTGVNSQDHESTGVFASGIVIRDVPRRSSNWRAEESLPEFLIRRQIVAIANIDTRKLTRLLREKGAQRGCIVAGEGLSKKDALDAARAFPGLKGMDLAHEVSVTESYVWNEGGWDASSGYRTASPTRYQVIAYDFGIKRNILRMLVDRGCAVTVVPAKTPAKQVLETQPDGVFLSNGPGDPEPCSYAIEAIRDIVDQGLPVFGICLGHQLLALASGARTLKMKFGHHGANHPVQDLDSNQVLITSQNHGFAVDDSYLPNNVRITHRSLFDGSVQGIARTDAPAFSFQGHPEASPGPHDIGVLFDRFVQMTQEYGHSQDVSEHSRIV
ncbi:MAG: glutamine-hydrolyzing carbamoyl-phosphate synthase small subunit [Gammaproteobacteria bacterium]|nr:glutamine-hydrolyzing carbamoyl-phosphate synthase small subunit [Gammaproteobacteria bacterium]